MKCEICGETHEQLHLFADDPKDVDHIVIGTEEEIRAFLKSVE